MCICAHHCLSMCGSNQQQLQSEALSSSAPRMPCFPARASLCPSEKGCSGNEHGGEGGCSSPGSYGDFACREGKTWLGILLHCDVGICEHESCDCKHHRNVSWTIGTSSSSLVPFGHHERMIPHHLIQSFVLSHIQEFSWRLNKIIALNDHNVLLPCLESESHFFLSPNFQPESRELK